METTTASHYWGLAEFKSESNIHTVRILTLESVMVKFLI